MSAARLYLYRNDREIECTVTGVYHAPDPAVGYFDSWWDDIEATNVEDESEVIELTAKEEDEAREKLSDNYDPTP